MPSIRGTILRILPLGILSLAALCAHAQNAGSVSGTVSDPTGAVVHKHSIQSLQGDRHR